MGRDYSRAGCTTCKLRRKKCDEKRPLCSGCARLGLLCSYNPESESLSQTQPMSNLHSMRQYLIQMPSLTKQVQILRSANFRNQTEELIVSRIPKNLEMFRSPFSPENPEDFRLLRQLLLYNEMIRDIGVAYFSKYMVGSREAESVGQMAFARGLRALQTACLKKEFDKTEITPILITMIYTGLKETFDPEKSVDALVHWNAAAFFAELSYRLRRHDFQKREFLMSFECIFYYMSTHLAYTKDIESAKRTWSRARIYSILEEVNPAGPDRMSSSMLLSGQYFAFEMNMRVIFLIRSQDSKSIDPDALDKLLTTINLEHQKSNHEMMVHNVNNSIARSRYLLYQIYQLFYQALRICVMSLYEEHPALTQTIDRLSSEAAESFTNSFHFQDLDRLKHRPHLCWIAVWPFSLFMCVVRDDRDFAKLLRHYESFKLYLGQAWRKRTEVLISRLSALRKSTESRSDTFSPLDNFNPLLPVGLRLLNQSAGLLG